MALFALILAVLGLSCSAYLWLELQKKPSNEHLREKLSIYSDELSKNYGKQFREIETEWADMYSKFMRLAGRVDKVRALESPKPDVPNEAVAPTRSDLLRRRRGGPPHNV